MFQVFIPHSTEDPASLGNVGLGDLVHGAHSLKVSQAESPSGEAGVLWFWPRPGKPQFGVRAGQTWVPAVASEGLPFSRYRVDLTGPLDPSELKRPYQERGRSVELGDGKKWLVPSSAELPRDLILADDGSVKFELQRQFAAYGIEVEQWRDRLAKELRGDLAGHSFADMLGFAIQALRINYRLTPEVCNQLRLFSTTNVIPTILAAIGARPSEDR